MFEHLVPGHQSFDSPLNHLGLTVDQQALYANSQFYSPIGPSEFLYSPTYMPSPPSTLISSDGEGSNTNDVDWMPVRFQTTTKSSQSTASNSKEDEDEEEEDDDQQSITSSTVKHPSKRRVAHNLVEKRYRNTINSEMERLRQMIPQIVTIDSQTPDGRAKASKATVLSSAVRYIQNLERDRHRLATENQELRIAVSNFTAYRK
jgi:hypothetical protein